MHRRKKNKKQKLTELGDEVWAAERLLRKRVVRNQVQYLVKWRGYSDKFNTYEPDFNILDHRLIDEFEKNQINKRKEVCKLKKTKLKKDEETSLDDEETSLDDEETSFRTLDDEMTISSSKIEKSLEKETFKKSENKSNEFDKSSTSAIEDNNQPDQNRSEIVNSLDENVGIRKEEEREEKTPEKIEEREDKNDQSDLKITNESNNSQSEMVMNTGNDRIEQEDDRIEQEDDRTEQEDDLECQNDQIELVAKNEVKHLLIPVSELEKLNNSKLNRQSSSMLDSKVTKMIIKQQINSKSLLKPPNLNLIRLSPIQQSVLSRPSISLPQTLLKVQSSNQRHILMNRKNSPVKQQISLIQSNLNQTNLNQSTVESHSLGNDLSFNVINLTNNNLNDNLNESPQNNSSILNRSSLNNPHFNQVVNPSITVNNNQIISRNNLVNIVKPINFERNKTKQNNQINSRQNLVQAVPSINSLLNRSKMPTQNNSHQLNVHPSVKPQPKFTSFQETSNAILNSNRLVKRHIPPTIFWRNNQLVNQITITDVVNDNVEVTIRECKAKDFFKKLKKKKTRTEERK